MTQTIHNWWYLEPRGALRPRAYALLEKLAARFCDAVFFINSDDCAARSSKGSCPRASASSSETASTRRDFPPASVARRANANDVSSSCRRRHRLHDGRRLEWPKDHETLLRAFARLRAERDDVTLVLAGQGLEERRVRTLTHELGIAPSVRFTGHCADVPGLLAASDILVLSSGYEGFGRCLVEGMVARLPVVGSDVPGIRDVIDDERTGLLVRASDVGALHAALRRLTLDPGLRSRLGSGGARGGAVAVRRTRRSAANRGRLSIAPRRVESHPKIRTRTQDREVAPCPVLTPCTGPKRPLNDCMRMPHIGSARRRRRGRRLRDDRASAPLSELLRPVRGTADGMDDRNCQTMHRRRAERAGATR